MSNRPRARMIRLRELGRTVRFRTTLAAVLVVGLVLLISGVAMVVLLRRSLIEDVRKTARFRAEAVAELIVVDSSADPIRVGDEEDEFVQVIDEHGAVVSSSSNVEGQPPLIELDPPESASLEVPFEDDPFLAVAWGAVTPEGTYTILAGRTIEAAIESSRVVTSLLVVGLPLLLLVLGVLTWRVTGRALAPVESIRARVEAISSRELHRRVPAPDSGDEIARLAITMNQMLDRLEESQVRQRRFVSDASHELRSPVASIRQQAELALTHPEEASAEELARVVLDEDLRIQRLVEDLLLLAKMDEQTLDGPRKPLDLDDVVFEEIDRIRQSSAKKIDAGGVSGGRVVGDRKQLARLVANLLENGVRHAQSRLSVTLMQEGDGVVLRVDDDGIGIPEEERERVFERFVRLQEARDRDSGGGGLGLAIVAEVSEVHGGKVRVLESPLGGARFEVRLPRGSS